jgi:hypothetical protein
MLHQVALVGNDSVPPDVLMALGAALNTQAQQLAQVWGISAVVSAFNELDSVPAGYWPISLVDDLPEGGSGVHRSRGGDPFAMVLVADNWPLIASHECLEMLVDPLGQKRLAGPSPIAGQGQVEFLVEICDPCQDPDNGYEVDGFSLSDFCTPAYYTSSSTSGTFSYNEKVKLPLQILDNGCLTWFDPQNNQWWQRTVTEGVADDERIEGPEDGLSDGAREWVHRHSASRAKFARVLRDKPWEGVRGHLWQTARRRSKSRAAQLRREIKRLAAGPKRRKR